jgi:ribonuclease HII
MTLFNFDINEKNDNNVEFLIGTDEAGRGPAAGGVWAAAVCFKNNIDEKLFETLNDSKKLTPKKREALYDLIIENAKAYSIIVIDEKKVDELNVYEASRQGMIEAVKTLGIDVDYVLTDAMPLRNEMAHEAIIKGDAKSISIAAASILAKVTRDRLMKQYDEMYPEYNFKKHKGYPTKEHKELLKKYGPCKIHRRSFGPVKECLNEQLSLFENEE